MTIKSEVRNVVLVHGAWHGSWCWEKLIPELSAKRWNVLTVDLPSASAGSDGHAGMYDDAGAIRECVERVDGPVVVVAHSYGGMPATEAAARAANVSHLIYLSAFQVEEGESLASTVRTHGGSLPAVDNGTMQPPGENAIGLFYGGASKEDAARALARLVPQTVRSFDEQLTSAAWKTIPSVFVVCEQDQAIPAAMQDSMATRATTVHRLDSDHSPFLSMPASLAQVISNSTDRNETATKETP
jgi:pimeloyl-ACP methyl ester carboxylesterase